MATLEEVIFALEHGPSLYGLICLICEGTRIKSITGNVIAIESFRKNPESNKMLNKEYFMNNISFDTWYYDYVCMSKRHCGCCDLNDENSKINDYDKLIARCENLKEAHDHLLKDYEALSGKYDDLKKVYDELAEDYVDLNTEKNELKKDNENLQTTTNKIMDEYNDLRSMNIRLKKAKESMEAVANKWHQYYEDILKEYKDFEKENEEAISAYQKQKTLYSKTVATIQNRGFLMNCDIDIACIPEITNSSDFSPYDFWGGDYNKWLAYLQKKANNIVLSYFASDSYEGGYCLNFYTSAQYKEFSLISRAINNAHAKMKKEEK